jgi:hypothetical protein
MFELTPMRVRNNVLHVKWDYTLQPCQLLGRSAKHIDCFFKHRSYGRHTPGPVKNLAHNIEAFRDIRFAADRQALYVFRDAVKIDVAERLHVSRQQKIHDVFRGRELYCVGEHQFDIFPACVACSVDCLNKVLLHNGYTGSMRSTNDIEHAENAKFHYKADMCC